MTLAMPHECRPPGSPELARRRPRRGLASVLAGALLSFLFARSAAATPEYPLVLDASLGTDCPRPLTRCLICHTTARGGQRTAVQPFANTLRMYGLSRGREATALQGALERLPADTDSDGDDISDKDELAACGNPSGEELGFGPEYGCDGAHLALELPSDAPLLLIAVGAAGLIVRRRRGAAPIAKPRDPPYR